MESNLNPRVGYGINNYQLGPVLLRKSNPLDNNVTAFDAEVIAVTSAVKLAILQPTARFSNNLWIFLDNLEVARRLYFTPIYSSQDAFTQSTNKALEWLNRTHLPLSILGEVKIHWILGHTGILGNDHVDRAIKFTQTLEPPAKSKLSITYCDD